MGWVKGKSEPELPIRAKPRLLLSSSARHPFPKPHCRGHLLCRVPRGRGGQQNAPRGHGQGQEQPRRLAMSRAWRWGRQDSHRGTPRSQHSSLKVLFLNPHPGIVCPLIFSEWKGRRKEEGWREGGKHWLVASQQEPGIEPTALQCVGNTMATEPHQPRPASTLKARLPHA